MGYQTYLEEALAEAEQQNRAYATARRQSLNDYLRALEREAALAAAQAQQNTALEIDSTRRAYDGAFDQNAIGERIARKNIAESMANLGLTDSGLNRTEQTAVGVTRARADHEVRVAQQEAVNRLTAQLQAYLQETRTKLGEQKAQATLAAEQDIADLGATLRREAQKRADTNEKASGDSAIRYLDAIQFVSQPEHMEERLSTYETAHELSQQLLDGTITQGYLSAQLSALLSAQHVSTRAVCNLIYNLQVSDYVKFQIAKAVSPGLYQMYVTAVSDAEKAADKR